MNENDLGHQPEIRLKNERMLDMLRDAISIGFNFRCATQLQIDALWEVKLWFNNKELDLINWHDTRNAQGDKSQLHKLRNETNR